MIDRDGIHPSSDSEDGVKIRVLSRTNSGVDTHQVAASLEIAIGLAQRVRVPTNQMVCILVGEKKHKRWDREPIIGENRWRSIDPGAPETNGPVRTVFRHTI
jgi:hypothetical protein